MSHEYPYSIKRHGTTLEKCEDEPVQTPGCIQSYGVLLILRPSDLTILQVSENSATWLGVDPHGLLAKNVAVAVGEPIAQSIRQALEHRRVEKAPLYLTTLEVGQQKNVRPLHVSLHTYLDLAFLELEDASASDPEPSNHLRVDPDYYGLVRETLTRFQETTSIQSLSQSITEEVRRITELNRVMVYRFHPDDSGEIIAESKKEGANSWLGFRYPPHDIPLPAREIFQKIWSRPVPDVRAELFEMVPLLNPDTGHPLDMTYCSLRGASIMYTEYLDNMGVRAALTLPLRRDNHLWGLVACHHDTPKVMSYRVRAAAEFLARSASQQLFWAEETENTEYRTALEASNYALMSKVALETELSAFTEGPIHLGNELDCGGAAIFFQETWNRVGQTPEIPELTELKSWLISQPNLEGTSFDPIFATDSLPVLFPPAVEYAGIGSGLLSFYFSRNPVGLILYFRAETLRELTWAGDPNELPVVAGPSGPRLSPRKSFELWRETVRNRSMPWKPVEIECIRKLRGLIIDRLVSSAEQLNDLRLRVTERTQEVVALNERAAALAAIVESSEDAIIGESLSSVITSWNQGAEKLFGYSASEVLGSSFRLLIPMDRQGEEDHILEIIGRGEGLRSLETLRISKDQRLIDVSITASPIRNSSGHVIGVSKVARDIAERKRAEARLQRLVNSDAQGVMFYNRTGLVVSANDAFLKLVGYGREDLAAGRVNWMAMTPLEYAEREQQILATLDTTGVCGPYEKEFIRKDASRVPVLLGAAAFEDNPNEGVCFVIDLTERKKLERQFLRAQRMESIGTLAGGIAHDLNNILAPILLSIDLLKSASDNSRTREILETIEVSAKRGADIVRQVLSFARGIEGQRIEVQPKHLLKDLKSIIKNTFPKDIDLRFSIPNEIWTILGDPTQVHQIMLNLCVNARDAMPNGGILSVGVDNCVIDDHYAGMHVEAKAGRYVVTTITDSGIGMAPDLIERIFEPFFTTKDLSQGSGLGLSTVTTIVKSHGGFINVYSEPGKGTTFKIYLPAVEMSSEAVRDSEANLRMPRGNGETILLVDDEASILKITSQTLQAFGYQVLTASDGADAVAVYADHKAEIDVVLTDMMMPVMDGLAMIHALRRLDPTIKIIAASGLATNGNGGKTSDANIKHFLTKPYTGSALLMTLRAILEEG